MPVIRAEHISKKYILSHLSRSSYTTFRESVTDAIKGAGKRLFRSGSAAAGGPSREEFWALKDVSFEIEKGDRIGIIGRNGAGKSTLLKMLSRIIEPTSGRITIRGSVASLLEVGTGFHPELTGRENIFLNGAILGMKRREIRTKFDEIIAFAEVEKFLDTPVKHYSSGMYVRLAFAVAAHLEPDILIVDEVLAVGDAQFQKKCLGKMEDVSAKEGRTVLFVSHQMGAIAQFCKKALLLNKGEVVQAGPVQEVVQSYMNLSGGGIATYEADGATQRKDIAIIRAKSIDREGQASSNFTHNQEIIIAIDCRINRWVSGSEVRVAVRDSKRIIFTTDTELTVRDGRMPHDVCAKVVIPANLLRPGQYYFTLATYLPNQIIFDLVDDAFSVSVIDGGSKYAASEGLDYGCIFVDCKWTVQDAVPCP